MSKKLLMHWENRDFLNSMSFHQIRYFKVLKWDAQGAPCNKIYCENWLLGFYHQGLLLDTGGFILNNKTITWLLNCFYFLLVNQSIKSLIVSMKLQWVTDCRFYLYKMGMSWKSYLRIKNKITLRSTLPY